MFRGSPGLTADQLANIGSVMGGNFNANTRENLTQYLFTVPSEDLDIALHIEALAHAGRPRHAGRIGTRSAAPSSRKWRRTFPAPITSLSRSCARRCSRARPMSMTRSARGRPSTRPTAAMLKAIPRQLVRAQQRDPGDRRRYRSAGDARKVEACSADSSRRSCPRAPAIKLEPVTPRRFDARRPTSPNGRDCSRCACRASTARISRRWKCCPTC